MKKLLLSLCTAASMIASPAFAQNEPNASNANPFDRMVEDNARNARSAPGGDSETAPKIEPIAARALYQYAGCVVETTRPGVVKLLEKDFRTEEYQRDIRKISKGHTRCVPGYRLRLTGVVLAGNFAEHLLSDKFTAAALSADLARDRAATPIAARSDQEAISLCIVMRAPQESAALFQTEVTSDKEKEAMQALAPHLSACIQQGTELRTNRIGLRALLALAAYRVAVTSKEGAAG
jgi:hypothetical protein